VPKLYKIAIALDPWKYKTFKKILNANGYTYTKDAKLKKPFIILTILTYDIEALKEVVLQCENKAQSLSHALRFPT
jgi:hypothetical protein